MRNRKPAESGRSGEVPGPICGLELVSGNSQCAFGKVRLEKACLGSSRDFRNVVIQSVRLCERRENKLRIKVMNGGLRTWKPYGESMGVRDACGRVREKGVDPVQNASPDMQAARVRYRKAIKEVEFNFF